MSKRSLAKSKSKGRRTKRARLETEVRNLANIHATVRGPYQAMNMATGYMYSDNSSVQLVRKLNESFLIERHGKEQCPPIFAGFQQIKAIGGCVRKGATAFSLGTFIPAGPNSDEYGYKRTLLLFHYHQCTFPADSPVHQLYRAACLAHLPFEKLSLQAICMRTLTARLLQWRHEDGPGSERVAELEARMALVNRTLAWPYAQNTGAEQVLAHYAPRLKWSRDYGFAKCGWDKRDHALRLPDRSLFRGPDGFYASVFVILGKYLVRAREKEQCLSASIWAKAVCGQLNIDFGQAFERGVFRHARVWSAKDEARIRPTLDIPEIVAEESSQ